MITKNFNNKKLETVEIIVISDSEDDLNEEDNTKVVLSKRKRLNL